MNCSIKNTFIFIIANCILLISCNEKLINKWTRLSHNPPSIGLEKKGKNGVGGNYLVESASTTGITEYYLKNSKGKTHILDLKLNSTSYRILFFEFTKNNLFIIINTLGPGDYISFKNFDLETGELILSDRGAIPCSQKTKMKDIGKRKYDWKLGNHTCEWINFESHQISYLRSGPVEREAKADSLGTLMEFNIFSYNWLENTLDTLPRNFSVGIDAFTGKFLGLRNIHYNHEKEQFEY